MSNGSSRFAPDQGALQEYMRPPSGATIAQPIDANALRARALALQAAHPPRPTAPKPDPGKVYVVLARYDGPELRVSQHVFNERPFVRVALWDRNWPVSKGAGVTVRRAELAAVAMALLDALDALEADGGQTPARSNGGAR